LSTFTAPRPNLYQSSAGFSVEIVGLTGLSYREGGRQVFVDSEIMSGPSGIGIYTASIRYWDSGEPVTPIDRDRIVENIRETFRFQGFEIDVM
jgi:hypothetical protein